jgi:hypothetical protein
MPKLVTDTFFRSEYLGGGKRCLSPISPAAVSLDKEPTLQYQFAPGCKTIMNRNGTAKSVSLRYMAMSMRGPSGLGGTLM